MAIFQFRARDRAGAAHAGKLDGESAAAVIQQLRQRNWMVIEVKLLAAQDSMAQLSEKLNPWNWLPIRSMDYELSCKQLAVMLRSGLTLLAALRTIAEHASKPKLRRVWERVAARIQEGASFATAMKDTARFPEVLLKLAEVGEQTGNLEQSVDRAADIIESRRRLFTSLMTALFYPTIVLVAAIAVTGYMVLGVIPKLKVFLQAMGRKLPAMTQFLIDASEFSQHYLPHFLIGTLILTGATIALYCSPSGRLAIDRWMLRVPLIGQLFRLGGTATFARTLGTLVRSGVTLLEGLRTAEHLLRNRYLANRVLAARQAVMQGSTLAEPLSTRYAFAPMLGRMVAVGESAGTIDDVLDEVAKFHDLQLQAYIRILSALVEPCIIVVVGSIVGFVYIAFFMALFAAGGA